MLIHGSADKLKEKKKINGTDFDGSEDITTEKWGTLRQFQLNGAIQGNASIDGGNNISIKTTVRSGTGAPSGGEDGDIYFQYN